MPDDDLKEELLQFGEGGRLFGILTLPGEAPPGEHALPVFVFLSAGMLHRVGPTRLHVLLSRQLANRGFTSLRVDLSGKGDSPTRPGLSNQQSVAADFDEILRILKRRLGNTPLVLAGLCSGADNAIRLTVNEPRVVGMVLLDPLCFPDDGFEVRNIVKKYTSPARYILWLKWRLNRLANPDSGKEEPGDPLALRDLPSREQMKAAFESIGRRDGRVLSVFTQYALIYYNRSGQLGQVLDVNGYRNFCTEKFWPESEHTYRMELHRRRLMDEIEAWAIGGYMRA